MKTRTSAIAGRVDDFIAAFNLGLRDDHALHADATGRVTAGYFHSRLSSVFQPVIEVTTGRVVGHEGLVRCWGGSMDAPTSPWSVFALAGLEKDLVELDRLCRTLHMLNYFRQAAAGSALFLNIDLRLLTAVRQGFGRAFEERLRRVGLKPRSIVIELPPAALNRHELLRQAIEDYRGRGYRVAVSCPGLAREWPEALWQARPDFVKTAVSGAPETLVATVKVAHDNGVTVIGEKVETPEQEEMGRAAGFDLLQGFRIGLPAVSVETAAPRRAARPSGEPQVLILPGLHGSAPGHWQSVWQDEQPHYRRVEQDDWDEPELDHWVERLAQAVKAQPGPVVVAAHSFGCLALARLASIDPKGLAGALLVAPANPDRFDVTWMLPIKRLPFPAIVVGSSNDPWMPLISAGWWAQRWGARFVNAGAVGHINVESGHGPWPEGRLLLDELLVESGQGNARTGDIPADTETRVTPGQYRSHDVSLIPVGFAI